MPWGEFLADLLVSFDEMAVSHNTESTREIFPRAMRGHSTAITHAYFFTIAFESSLPGEKRTRSLAGTVIF